MRALVVSAWSPYRATDGDSLVLAHHLRELAGRHELAVLAADDGDGGDPAGGPLPEAVSIRSFGANLLGPMSVVGRRVTGMVRLEPDHVRWVERPGLLRAIDVELHAHPPDVVHLFGWGTAQLRGRLRGVPCVHMPVDGWSDGVHNRALPWWRRATDVGQPALVRRHERRHYPHCGAVVVVAPGERDRLAAQVPEARIEVITNGVDPGPPPTRRTPGDAPTLVFHGSFGTRANQDASRVLATEVLPLVHRRHPAARVALVGRDDGPEVRALAGKQVEVTGAVPDVAAALQRADVYVVPMVSGSGIKNKVLEAMAAGRPVVATTLAMDGIGAGPGVLVGDDPAEMARHVADLLADPARAEAMGRDAWERVCRDHSWARSARALEALWADVAGC